MTRMANESNAVDGRSDSQRGLLRTITLVPATSIIIATIIGSGVFVKARVMTCNVGSPEMVLLVWVVAGLLSLAGALVYAELGTMMPLAGGPFNFLGAAYGRLWAFLYAWTRSVAVGASIAALAIVFVIFLNDLLGARLSPLMLEVLPIVVIAGATVLNFNSARANGAVATALSVGKVGLVVGVGVAAFLLGDGSWAGFGAGATCADCACAGVPETARLGVTGFGAALLGALWGYNGWAVVTFMGGEVKDPARTLPRALIGGVSLIIAVYVLVNAAYFYILSPAQVASVPESSSVAYEVVVRLLGAGAASVFAAGLMLSAYGTLHATVLAASRIPYALSLNALLPRSLSQLSSHGVPVFAVLAVGAWSIVLSLSGTFDILTDIYIFVLWIFYAMTATTVFVLRRKYPDVPRPYRVLGYPVVPALFVLVALYLLLNTLAATPLRALAGLGLVLSGLPVYAYYTRGSRSDRQVWMGRVE